MYRALPRFLFRAPLLPVREMRGALKGETFATAVELASPDLVAAGGTAKARVALERYRRRAAFRPTPAGLLAGVGVGRVGARTEFGTGTPDAVFRVRWQRLAALGRALLDVPEVREESRLRRAPSTLLGAETVTWLGGGGTDFLEERQADLDDVLATVLATTPDWTPWQVVRAAVAALDDDGEASREGVLGEGVVDEGVLNEGTVDEAAVDEFLRSLIDDGLLHTDLVPPLVGPSPAPWLQARLSSIVAAAPVAEELAQVDDLLRDGDWRTARAVLDGLPGGAESAGAGPVDATLVFARPARATLARAGVARAAALAPLLFRLQEALTPPAAERTPAPALADALDATTEIFGAGALDLAAFARGDYGVDPAEGEREGFAAPFPAAPPPERALLTFLLDHLQAAARDGALEIALRSDQLDRVLPGTATPPTCELFVTPCRPRAGARPGTGWLLGLHAPAGASWGRFAFALGASADPLFEALRAAEARARPGEQALDVVLAPSERLADICCHPPLRAAALALGGWPASEQAALTVADLQLVADPAALEPLALRHVEGRPVAPSPLHRVRSTTAAPGVWRLLAGWTLFRQHAPWAAHLGPLSELTFTPRLSIDGFVVAPASWRIPVPPGGRRLTARDVATWRRAASVPRFVQVGQEDELLPVDLDATTAAAELAGATRAYEIWPPLGDTPDQSGRRVEAVVALAEEPDDAAAAAIAQALTATTAAGPIGPRSAEAIDGHWCTFKIFGAADRQELVLLGAVEPAVQQAETVGDIAGWFFLRYIDGPGRRPHLRLRVRVSDPDGEAAFARILDHHLRPALAAGAVVAVERAPYFPESARYGGPSVMPAVHRLFRADSQLACSLLALLSEPDDPLELSEAPNATSMALTCAFDALARAFGLDAGERRALAERRLRAHGDDPAEQTQETAAQGRAYRHAGPRLRTLLAAPPPPLADALSRLHGEAAAAVLALDVATRARILPPLLHLAAVRLAGPDRDAEVLAYAFWQRTLDSLAHHRARPRPTG